MTDQAPDFTYDVIKAMPIVDGPSDFAPATETVSMSDMMRYWIDPASGVGYDIEKRDGLWVRYPNGMINPQIVRQVRGSG